MSFFLNLLFIMSFFHLISIKINRCLLRIMLSILYIVWSIWILYLYDNGFVCQKMVISMLCKLTSLHAISLGFNACDNVCIPTSCPSLLAKMCMKHFIILFYGLLFSCQHYMKPINTTIFNVLTYPVCMSIFLFSSRSLLVGLKMWLSGGACHVSLNSVPKHK